MAYIEKFYTAEQYFADRFDRVGRRLELKAETAEEFSAWKKELRKALWEVAGMNTMISCEPNPQRLESKEMEGYRRDKYLIETEPGICMPFYVLIPGDYREGEKRPAIVAPHGHESHGKSAVVGETFGNPSLAATIEQHNYAYGVQLVKEGFLVFCPDARGFWERREKYYQADSSLLSQSCEYLNDMAMTLGQSVTGMWIWDLMRLVDYIQTREDVDVERIGCAGLSGGGLQSLWLSALDDRIKCSVISGYFYGYKQSILLNMCCSCNYVRGLYELADMGDIGALILPRPVLIETGTLDDLNGPDGLANVYPQVEKLRKAAAITDAKENVYHDVFVGPHRWNGVQAVPWLKKHLLG